MLPKQRFRTSEGFHEKSAQEPTGSSTRKKSIWDLYNEIAAREDTTRQQEWKELTETILLLAALFTAVVAGFLVAIMDKLEPAKDDEIVGLLENIYNRLSNSSTTAEISPNFAPAPHIVAASAFLYASLALLLIIALMCMLVKGWNRDFDRGLTHDTVPEERARKREYCIRGLTRYKLPMIVSALPILLQISLILFCVGLMFLLFHLDQRITWGTLSIFIAGVFIYLFTTLIAIFDPSAPFPSPISRFFTHPRWRKMIDSIQLLILKPSLVTRGITIYSLANPFRHWVLATAKKLKPLARSETSGVEYDVRIMNRIAQETLVADENVFTFIVLSERLLLSARIRPCSKERWRHILSSLRHSIMDVEPPSARRGIFRVAAIVFEPNAPNCDPILEMTRKWLQSDPSAAYPPPSQTHVQPQASHSSTQSHLQPRTDTSSATSKPGWSFDRLPIFESLSSLSSVLSQVRHIFDTRECSKASERIKEQETPAKLSAELLWLANFVESSLFAGLENPIRGNLIEGSLRFLQEILVLVSMFLTEGATPLINNSMRLGEALLRAHGSLGAIPQSPDRTPHQSPNSGKLFMLESNVIADPTISFEAFANILQFGTMDNSPIGGMLVPLMLALLKADPTSSLYANRDLVGLQPTFVKISLECSGNKSLEHSQILQSVSGAISKRRLAYGFAIFLRYWNHQTQNPRAPIDDQYFKFFEVGLDLLIRRDDRKYDREAIVSKLLHMSHPWLSLAVDAFLCQRRPNLHGPDFYRTLGYVDWQRIPTYEPIVEMTMRMWIPFGGSMEPDANLLNIFSTSTTFRTAIQCLSFLPRLNDRYRREEFMSPTDIAHLKGHFELVFSKVDQDQVLADWLVLAEVVLPVWETLPATWKDGFLTTFRERHGCLQWLDRVLKSLLTEVSKISQNGGAAGQEDTDQGGEEGEVQLSKYKISGFLPLLDNVLESTSSTLTQDEVRLLSKWDLAALSESFGETIIRERILARMAVGSSGLPGVSMHESGAVE